MENATRLRNAGHNEHRTIIRDALGFYGTIVATAVYHHDGLALNEDLLPYSALLAGLFASVRKHPILSAVTKDAFTEHPYYARPITLQLDDHLVVHPTQDITQDCTNSLKHFITQVHNTTVHSHFDAPAWKLHAKAISRSCFIAAFSFSHPVGDGISGLAFHRTFLTGLKLETPESTALTTQDLPDLPPPLEEAGRLTISWSFLFAPALATYLPEFVGKFLGVQANQSSAAKVWTGGQRLSAQQPLETSLALQFISDETLRAVLAQCRAHSSSGAEVRLTGLLSHVLARVLRKVLAQHGVSDAANMNLVVSIALDMRRLLDGKITTDDMANTTSTTSERFMAESGEIWKAAGSTTSKLSSAVSSLHDQAVGLLRYLSSFRSWTENRARKEPEASFEVSNVGVFDPLFNSGYGTETAENGISCTVDKIVFSQSADATGCPIHFNLVSLKGGDLAVAMTWRTGQLGIGDEHKFADDVCGSIREDLESLA